MNRFDRRRVALASVFTLVALPALWVFNRSDPSRSAAPNAAVIGAPSGGGAVAPPSTEAYVPEVPVFLGNSPAPAEPAVVNIAVPALPEGNILETRASYRRYPDATNSPCTTTLVPYNTLLTVVNINNGQAIQCLNTFGTALPVGVEIVIHTDQFMKISDLADAPTPVRITW
jgi:hypothetical protein